MKYKIVQQFNSNLSFFKTTDSISNSTNYLINKEINKLINTYDKDTTFILYSFDDSLTMIAYKILKNIQTLKNYKIYLYGEHKRIKKQISKNDKFLNSFQVKRQLKKENTILVSPFNPVYQVVDYQICYKDFTIGKKKEFIIKNFNIEALYQTILFYGVNYIKNDFLFDKNNKILKDYRGFSYLDYESPVMECFSGKYDNGVKCVMLSGDTNKDNELLNILENVDELIFYYYNNNESKELLENSCYRYCIKNSVNIPNRTNMNNYKLPKEISSDIIYIGNWKQEDISKIEKGEELE